MRSRWTVVVQTFGSGEAWKAVQGIATVLVVVVVVDVVPDEVPLVPATLLAPLVSNTV